jgi:hypothetical protein
MLGNFSDAAEQVNQGNQAISVIASEAKQSSAAARRRRIKSSNRARRRHVANQTEASPRGWIASLRSQ